MDVIESQIYIIFHPPAKIQTMTQLDPLISWRSRKLTIPKKNVNRLTAEFQKKKSNVVFSYKYPEESPDPLKNYPNSEAGKG